MKVFVVLPQSLQIKTSLNTNINTLFKRVFHDINWLNNLKVNYKILVIYKSNAT